MLITGCQNEISIAAAYINGEIRKEILASFFTSAGSSLSKKPTRFIP